VWNRRWFVLSMTQLMCYPDDRQAKHCSSVIIIVISIRISISFCRRESWS
jgi:hypothetical protein